MTSPWGIHCTVCFVSILHLAFDQVSSLIKHHFLKPLDAKTRRLTDVLQQFRDGVYPQYNPEKVSVNTLCSPHAVIFNI